MPEEFRSGEKSKIACDGKREVVGKKGEGSRLHVTQFHRHFCKNLFYFIFFFPMVHLLACC